MNTIATHPHSTLRGQMGEFFSDMGHEIEREAHMDSSKSDLMVRKHIDGLAIFGFSLVELFLMISIAVLYLVLR